MKTKLFIIALVAFTGSALAQTSNYTSNVLITVFNQGEKELTVMVSRDTTNAAERLDFKRRIQPAKSTGFEIPRGQYTVKADSYSDEGKILPGTGTTQLSGSITNREYWTYKNVRSEKPTTIGWKMEVEPRRKM